MQVGTGEAVGCGMAGRMGRDGMGQECGGGQLGGCGLGPAQLKVWLEGTGGMPVGSLIEWAMPGLEKVWSQVWGGIWC